MTHDDDALARLVREAADQVEPRPALDAIRTRTATPPKESTMTIARTWLLGGLGGAVATAAVIGGVWFATASNDTEPGPAVDPTPSVSESAGEGISPSPMPTDSAAGDTEKVTLPIYYLGEAPGGFALYREFQPAWIPTGGGVDAKVKASVNAALSGSPLDPDYSSPWPDGSRAEVGVKGDQITIGLYDDGSGSLHDRPSGMSERQAQLALEQLIYTVQAAAGRGRLPVQFLLEESHTDQVLGQPASEPLANGPLLETLSLVNISSPSEGEAITGDKLTVTGVANSFEANVVVKLQRFEGTEVALQEPVTADGWMDEKLFPFSGSFDISDVPPGRYVLSATTDDPSGGAEGNGPFTDTKVIEIT